MITEERLISTHSSPIEQPSEYAMRPQALEDYVGQEKLKQQLGAAIHAAKRQVLFMW